MRAGKLDRSITLQRVVMTDDGFGSLTPTTEHLAGLRAQIIDQTTDEFMRGYGSSTEAVRVFRTRYIDGVQVGHEVTFGGQTYIVKGIKEIGRRRGLELRCVAIGTGA